MASWVDSSWASIMVALGYSQVKSKRDTEERVDSDEISWGGLGRTRVEDVPAMRSRPGRE